MFRNILILPIAVYIFGCCSSMSITGHTETFSSVLDMFSVFWLQHFPLGSVLVLRLFVCFHPLTAYCRPQAGRSVSTKYFSPVWRLKAQPEMKFNTNTYEAKNLWWLGPCSSFNLAKENNTNSFLFRPLGRWLRTPALRLMWTFQTQRGLGTLSALLPPCQVFTSIIATLNMPSVSEGKSLCYYCPGWFLGLWFSVSVFPLLILKRKVSYYHDSA